MRHVLVFVVVLIAASPRVAHAGDSHDFEFGVRWSAGFGAALEEVRPVFLGTFGLDMAVPVSGRHSLGVALNAMWRERPSDNGDARKIESDVLAFYRFRRGRKRGKHWDPWFDIGGGYRQLSYDDDEPMLGSIVLHGVSLAFGGGADYKLSRGTQVGLFFNWTLGCYMKSTRRDVDDYLEEHDEPPPAPRDPSCVDTGTSMYSGGLRWSMQFH